MSNKALKRIKNDIKIITSSDLDKEGIFVSFDDENLFHAKALVIGPYTKNSPYQGGFYFFDITFPNNYPLSPPSVKFMTLNNSVRFNPNLYKCGKVCLSILNTWSGPGWTSSQNLMSVLLVLQSLLHEHPIQNEPGWENEIGLKSKYYNNTLAYYNIKVAVIQMIENIPYGFEEFREIIENYLKDNIEKYKSFIKDYYQLDGLEVKSGIYSMYIRKYNIKEIEKEMLGLIEKIEKKDS